MVGQTNRALHYFKVTSCWLLIGLFLVALLAPFTFMKPPVDGVTKKDPNVKVIPIEKPLHNVKLPKFAKIKDVKEKKRTFFAFIKPAVEKQNNKILSQRNKLLEIKERYLNDSILTKADKSFLAKLSLKYKSKTQFGVLAQIDKLLLKVDIVPIPLVLAQAANESAWGTSRFARIGLNFFGMWCFEKGCGMVPRSRNEGAFHEVAAFSSVEEAITKYLHNINTNTAYSVFRTIRGQLRLQELPLTPEILATGLLPYSERGTDYVLEITDMIRHNRKYF